MISFRIRNQYKLKKETSVMILVIKNLQIAIDFDNLEIKQKPFRKKLFIEFSEPLSVLLYAKLGLKQKDIYKIYL